MNYEELKKSSIAALEESNESNVTHIIDAAAKIGIGYAILALAEAVKESKK